MPPLLDALQSMLGRGLGSAVWPFFRVAGLVMVAPVFGARVVPARIKIALSVALSLLLGTVVSTPRSFDLSFATGVVVVQEVLLGIALGFALQLLFEGLVLAGQTIAMTMGLGFATMVDPERGVSVPVLGQFLLMLGILVFLSMGGHLALIRLLADSFTLAPIGEPLTRQSLHTILGWGGFMFAAALRIALPAVTALVVVNLAFGVMSRAAPTLNLFAVGFPAALLAGFLVLLLGLGSFVSIFSGELAQMLRELSGLLGG